jgi:hypothetical protein
MVGGYWINYDRERTFQADEHESWLRSSGNAKKLGVPPNVISMFDKFKPMRDRDKFLMFVMQHAPIMRVRGHGDYMTFEYNSRSRREPLDAIWMFGKKNLGPFSTMLMVNFATKENTQMSFQEFEENMQSDGYEAVMRVASRKIFINKRLAAELLALSKELLR